MNSDKTQPVKAVLLLGGWNARQDDDATHREFLLWPVLGTSICERILRSLAAQGVQEAEVYGRSEASRVREIVGDIPGLRWNYTHQELPTGTAGSLREAAYRHRDSLLLILPGNCLACPDVRMLLQQHEESQADLTVMLAQPRGEEGHAEIACAYLCRENVLLNTTCEAYADIKETLLPGLVTQGKHVSAIRESHPVVRLSNWREYLDAVCWQILHSKNGDDCNAPSVETTDKDASAFNIGNTVNISDSARIADSARLVGPVHVMDGVEIGENVAIIGPAVLERNVKLEKDSLVAESVLWPGARVGRSCTIRGCLLTQETDVPDHHAYKDVLYTSTRRKPHQSHLDGKRRSMEHGDNMTAEHTQYTRELRHPTEEPADTHTRSFAPILAGLLLVAGGLLWSHWSTLSDLWSIWLRSDEYSSGLLVPPLAAYLIWARRSELAQCQMKPALLGIIALLAMEAFRIFGLLFMYGSAMRLAFVLSVIACVYTLFGGQIVRRLWPVLLFLFLMLPLPRRIEGIITLPLQRWATSSAVFCLETLGYDALREGNIIHIGDTSVAVAEACNGLRMITGFIVISALVVLLVKRSWWEKAVLLCSALPIALLCNTIRLSLTSIAFTFTEDPSWREALHDYGGYAMMPLALACVCGELSIMKRLVISPVEAPEKNEEHLLVAPRNAKRRQAES